MSIALSHRITVFNRKIGKKSTPLTRPHKRIAGGDFNLFLNQKQFRIFISLSILIKFESRFRFTNFLYFLKNCIFSIFLDFQPFFYFHPFRFLIFHK